MLLLARMVLATAVGAIALGPQHDQLPGPVRTEDPAEPGNGATLVVIAPESLCNNDLELMVTRTIPAGRRYVFQTPVLPPQCRWTISGVNQGDYQAVLQKARGDQRVVAMSRIEVHPGSTWTTTISPLSATVEGVVTVKGVPVAAGAYVEVKQNGEAGWSWETRTDRDGYYKVAVQPDTDLCVRVMLPNALNSIFPQCLGFGAGANRRDFDIPPGRIVVTLVPREGPIHATQISLVDNGPGQGGSAQISVTGRIERSFVGLAYGKHRIRATTIDYLQDFDAVDVLLSPNEPVKAVTLSVPYSR